MNHPLRCRCSSMAGFVASPRVAARAVCYCRDCQAFARFLQSRQSQPSERTLDGNGGTDIVATLPRHVHFTKGVEHLRCMSLSDKGLLRWYAGCCHTPLGNTPRDPKISYVGLVRSCLEGSPDEIDASFGRATIALNTESAVGHVRSTPLAAFFGLLKIVRNVLGARLSGRTGENPFFRPGSSEPIVAPHVIAAEERRRLKGKS